MWLEAIVPKNDLARLAADVLPLTVRLGDDGEIHLSDATEVTLIPDVGLRLVCSVELRWPVLGVTVPITVRSLAVILRPEVIRGDGTDHKEQIAFKIQIDQADFAGLHPVLDQGVVILLNRELDKHTELAWGYARTLSQSFDLPDAVHPPESFELAIDGARAKTTEESLSLGIQFHARVHRADGDAPSAAERPQTGPNHKTPAATNPSGSGSGTMRGGLFGGGWAEAAALAALGVVALVVGYVIGTSRAPRRPALRR
jgi:hypothetical protein